MAHFAQLDENNKVVQVVVLDNNDCLDENGNESEQVGVSLCKQLFGEDTNWLQTSYNASIRKSYAGVGFTYDSLKDAFIPPKPFQSWIFDEDIRQWHAPVPHPQDGGFYSWDENTLNWINKESYE